MQKTPSRGAGTSNLKSGTRD